MRLNEFGIEELGAVRRELKALKNGKLFFEGGGDDYDPYAGMVNTNPYMSGDRGYSSSQDNWVKQQPSVGMFGSAEGKGMQQLWGESFGSPADYQEMYMDDLASYTQGMNQQQIVDFAVQNNLSPSQFRYHPEQFPQFAGVSDALADQGIYGMNKQYDFNAANAEERANKSSHLFKAGMQTLGDFAPTLTKMAALSGVGAGLGAGLNALTAPSMFAAAPTGTSIGLGYGGNVGVAGSTGLGLGYGGSVGATGATGLGLGYGGSVGAVSGLASGAAPASYDWTGAARKAVGMADNAFNPPAQQMPIPIPQNALSGYAAQPENNYFNYDIIDLPNYRNNFF